MAAGRFEEAKAAYDEAEARNMDGPGLRVDRAILAFLQKDNIALAEQWEWVAKHPKSVGTMLGKAQMFRYYGQLRAARLLTEDTIKQMKESAPNADFAGIYAGIAMQEAVVGNTAQAQQATANALAGPQLQSAQSNLALALALAGDSVQAQKVVDSINQKSPLNTLVQNYELPAIRAVLHLNAKDPAGAIEVLRPALKYDFAFEEEGFNSLYPAYFRGLA
jgi:tetratricopeptide (TPR) repeat protein